ncbi:MAG: fibronectin type III domain-containing protein [Nitrospira sp.]|nr:fibronectin type III domain-containing protein [Nitrospira sp.]MDH4369217.1 fibronectin type III domain-containing protein [Nitrospira sp.]MDH5346354.1 fibronectin type III domain-containing protein [Nitrospira sp.]MDH5496667.1 fibronectin type III domain-containing protein [Nitrospira sp.]MDH5724830.1 fibronectin type III domain-containing protein [Nitrospira sp.]
MEPSKWMIRSYHLLQISFVLLVATACASPDSSPTGEMDTVSNTTATLSWNASAGLDVAGYKIYQATSSGVYGAPIAAIPMDVTSYAVTGLESGATYFFVVTAYNSDGTESPFSNEASTSIL